MENNSCLNKKATKRQIIKNKLTNRDSIFFSIRPKQLLVADKVEQKKGV